ncbi:MAG TPA: hypothetical protein PK863_06770, partial [Candidatus Dojkabacteria bacterium]|nr:hypothetical protein [Candidatus Dojkabacteria bacterium]
RGRRSRNKVSVGEPAEGSLTQTMFHNTHNCKVVYLEEKRRKKVTFWKLFLLSLFIWTLFVIIKIA